MLSISARPSENWLQVLEKLNLLEVIRGLVRPTLNPLITFITFHIIPCILRTFHLEYNSCCLVWSVQESITSQGTFLMLLKLRKWKALDGLTLRKWIYCYADEGFNLNNWFWNCFLRLNNPKYFCLLASCDLFKMYDDIST